MPAVKLSVVWSKAPSLRESELGKPLEQGIFEQFGFSWSQIDCHMQKNPVLAKKNRRITVFRISRDLRIARRTRQKEPSLASLTESKQPWITHIRRSSIEIYLDREER